MNESEIFTKVLASADCFGSRNSQQFKFLSSLFSKYKSEVVLAGLLRVFFDSSATSTHSERQELAGMLLERLKPEGSIDLVSTILAVAPHYELSVEQLPLYFARVYGEEAVVLVINKLLEKEKNEKTKRALKTMRWWIRNFLI